MNSFLLALQFLTIIPLKLKNAPEQNIPRSMVYFPLAGFLLGLALVIADKFLFFLNLGQLSIDIILVILLAGLTGGLHLDGLADTADAFLSRKNKESMLAIMRDSHIGAMGVLALISAILLKIALLYALNISLKPIALILMLVASRWVMVLLMFNFPYARPDGKAKLYIQGANFGILACATLVALVFVFIFWQFNGLLVLLSAGAAACLLAKMTSNKIGGITGDTLGAIGEVTEILVLFFSMIMGRFIYG